MIAELERADADIVIGTEVGFDCLGGFDHLVDAGDDWGYGRNHPQRRKVAMWAQNPWSDVEVLDGSSVPGGRLIAATTDTDLGQVRVVGVCIPWADAHVRTGRRDRSRWEDHVAFLIGLEGFLADQPHPLIVAGDFNQRIPRGSQPRSVAADLDRVLSDMRVPTAGPNEHGFLIDHIAHTSELDGVLGKIICPKRQDGALSDHHGAVVEFASAV